MKRDLSIIIEYALWPNASAMLALIYVMKYSLSSSDVPDNKNPQVRWW
jgi:hypothetical protein